MLSAKGGIEAQPSLYAVSQILSVIFWVEKKITVFIVVIS